MARKLALIIGNSHYEDSCLAKLAAPDVDVRALADVLRTPNIGAFDEVTPVMNEGLATVRKAIARFFDLKHRDDLLFLYFSGHGVRDEQGHLYLAVRDTERAVLAGTAIEASYVTTRMDHSASKRLVLVLDCCHSGAFGFGSKAAQGAAVGTATAFEGTGRGRVVLTATDSTQFAWEGDSIIGDVENSLFTHYLIEGLRTGAADIDQDGQITIDELYDYIYEHVLNETPKQTPGKWTFGQQGDIVIAQNPTLTVPRLPIDIEEALKSNLPSVRFQALTELKAVLQGRHEGRAHAARAALDRLVEDDSRKVAAGAQVLRDAFDNDETIADDEWLRRVQQREREISGPKAVLSQVESYVATAKACLEKGDEAGARELVARAAALDATHPDVVRLQQRLTTPAKEDQPTPPVIQHAGTGTIPRASMLSPAVSAIRWLRANTLSSTAMRVVASLVVAVGVGMMLMTMPASPPINVSEPKHSAPPPSTAPTTTPTTTTTTPPPPEPTPSPVSSAAPLASGEKPSPTPTTTGKKPGDGGGRGRSGSVLGGPGLNSGSPGSRTSAPPTVEPKKPAEDRVVPTSAPPNATTTPTPATTTAAPERETRKPDPAPADPPKPESKTVDRPEAPAAPRPIPNEASLRESVRAYAQAFSSGNRDEVKSVFPEISQSELKEFDALRDDFGLDRYGMNISIKSVKIDGTRARVSCVIFHTGIDNTGKSQQIRSNQELNFAWTGTTWVRVR